MKENIYAVKEIKNKNVLKGKWQSRNTCPLAGTQSNDWTVSFLHSKYFYFRLRYTDQGTYSGHLLREIKGSLINYRRNKPLAVGSICFPSDLVLAFLVITALSLVDLPFIRVASKMIPTHVQVCSESFYPDLYFD